MRQIIIEISGGNVQEIYSTEKENDAVSIHVIDWDNIEAGELNDIKEFPLNYINKQEIDDIIIDANSSIKKNRNKYE